MNSDPCARIKYVFRGIGLLLGSIEGYVSRNAINPDGRSYLDLAQAYLHHDWATTINAYWSPLYAWLLALTLGVTRPSLRSEFPVVHALNVALFFVSLAAFEFFWSGLMEVRKSTDDVHKTGGMPETVLWSLGYPFFIWLSVGSLVSMINPDLVVMTLVLLIAGLLIRIHGTGDSVWHLHFLLGLLLGIGYLAKAVMFPAGFLFVAATSRNQPKTRWLQPIVVALVFLVVCSPQIIVLSRAKGRLTFADTGRLAYAWYTYHLPVRNWQGSPTSGTPVHPTRKLYEHPTVFEFNGPIQGSYPPWQDPSYWNEGMRPVFNSLQMARHVRQDLTEILGTILQPRYWICGMLLILFGAAPRESLRTIGRQWVLIVPALLVMAMYAVTFVTFRYFPPWVLLLWSAFLAGVRLRGHLGNSWMYRVLAIILAGLLLAATAHGTYGQARHGRGDDATPEYETVEGLAKVGLRSGTKVAAIGFDNDAHWAYLGGFNVIAEIGSDDACAFWSAPLAERDKVLSEFARTGANAVIANGGSGVRNTMGTSLELLQRCTRDAQGWTPIPGTRNLVYMIR
jgi:hypothetical protein